MSKHTNRIPPALKHGIYSGIGLLPTEDPTEFQKFKQEIFDDYTPVGRSEKNIVDKIACLMWRSQNLATYGVAMRARARHDSIYFKLEPPLSYEMPILHQPETRSPEGLEALRKRADEQVRTELGAAIELVENRRRLYDRVLGERARHQGTTRSNDRSTSKELVACARDQVDVILCQSRTISAASG
jgi:hypothetical protein